MRKLYLTLIALCCTSYAAQAMKLHDQESTAALAAHITTQVNPNLLKPVNVRATIEGIIRRMYADISDVECWILTTKVILKLSCGLPS